jgi:hypothetical protein
MKLEQAQTLGITAAAEKSLGASIVQQQSSRHTGMGLRRQAASVSLVRHSRMIVMPLAALVPPCATRASMNPSKLSPGRTGRCRTRAAHPVSREEECFMAQSNYCNASLSPSCRRSNATSGDLPEEDAQKLPGELSTPSVGQS